MKIKFNPFTPVSSPVTQIAILIATLLLSLISCQQGLSVSGPGTSTEVVGCIRNYEGDIAPGIPVLLSRYSEGIQWYTKQVASTTNSRGEFTFEDIVDTGLYLLEAVDNQGRKLIEEITLGMDLQSRTLGTLIIDTMGSLKGYILDNTDFTIDPSTRVEVYKGLFPICGRSADNSFTIDSLPPGQFRVEILGQLIYHDDSYRASRKITLLDSTITIPRSSVALIDTIDLNKIAIQTNDSTIIAEINVIRNLLLKAGSEKDVSAGWFNPTTGHMRIVEVHSENNMALDEALQILAAFPAIEKLRLSGFSGTTIPEKLFSMQQLSELSLTDGEIEVIPERLSELQNLSLIEFNNNAITELPDILIDKSIPYLQSVDLTGNPLKRIEWEQQQQINSLYLDGVSVILSGKAFAINERDYRALLSLFESNNLDDRMVHPYITTGSGINNQDAVVTLSINDVSIRKLPSDFDSLTQLRSLYISSNSIDTLADVFGNLSELENLHLANGTISVLPIQLGRCTSLKTIDFSNNHIVRLPKWLAILGSLIYADFSYNCIDTSNTIVPSKCIVDQIQCGDSSPAPDSLFTKDTIIVNSIINYSQKADQPLVNYVQLRNNRVVLLRLVVDSNTSSTDFDTLCTMASRLDSLKTLHCIFRNKAEKVPVTTAVFTNLEEFIGSGGFLLSLDSSFTASFPSLKKIALPGNHFSSIPNAIKSITSITSVDLYFNYLTDLTTSDSLWLDVVSNPDRRVLWDSNFGYYYSYGLKWHETQFNPEQPW